MHEDPTRMMGQPDHHRPHGNMRLLIAGLIAVIVGLLIAIAVIAGDDEGGTTSTVTTGLSETGSTAEATTDTTTDSTTETTAPPTTETTAPETTTTAPPSEEEDPGSGGVPAP